MTRAPLEDSARRPFGGQSTSPYSSAREENRNTRFFGIGFPRKWRPLRNYPSALCATVLYDHPEFAYPIMNLRYVNSPVAEDQAAPGRRFQVACGQGNCGNALLGSLPRNRHI